MASKNIPPWAAQAVDLETIHGPYSVYAAWCEWFEAWNERQSDNLRMDLDVIDKTSLFSAFEEACSQTEVVPAKTR